MGVALEPHPQLGLLSGLIGVWEGEGRGSWDGRPEFHYRERLTFTHAGKPMLAYAQETWALDDGRLRYTLAMSVGGSAPVPHLSAELRRAPS